MGLKFSRLKRGHDGHECDDVIISRKSRDGFLDYTAWDRFARKRCFLPFLNAMKDRMENADRVFYSYAA